MFISIKVKLVSTGSSNVKFQNIRGYNFFQLDLEFVSSPTSNLITLDSEMNCPFHFANIIYFQLYITYDVLNINDVCTIYLIRGKLHF